MVATRAEAAQYLKDAGGLKLRIVEDVERRVDRQDDAGEPDAEDRLAPRTRRPHVAEVQVRGDRGEHDEERLEAEAGGRRRRHAVTGCSRARARR